MCDIFQRRNRSALFIKSCVSDCFIKKPDSISERLKFAVIGKKLQTENMKLRDFGKISGRERTLRLVQNRADGFLNERFCKCIGCFRLALSCKNLGRGKSLFRKPPASTKSGACSKKNEKDIGQAGMVMFSKRKNCLRCRLGRKDRGVAGFQKVWKQFFCGLISFVRVEHGGFDDNLANRVAELHEDGIFRLVFAGDAIEKQDPERINITSKIGLLIAKLLRRGSEPGSHDQSIAGFGGIEKAGNAKIDEMTFPEAVHDNILRLDIPVEQRRIQRMHKMKDLSQFDQIFQSR